MTANSISTYSACVGVAHIMLCHVVRVAFSVKSFAHTETA